MNYKAMFARPGLTLELPTCHTDISSEFYGLVPADFRPEHNAELHVQQIDLYGPMQPQLHRVTHANLTMNARGSHRHARRDHVHQVRHMLS